MKTRSILLALLLFTTAFAQSGALEGLKANSAKNKAALAHYSWQEMVVLSVDGEAKSTTISKVQLDATGKPQKTLISEQDAPQKNPRGPIRKHIKERKVEEFKDYVTQVTTLAQSYAHLDPQLLETSFKNGNLSIDNSAGAGKSKFTIKSYLKPGDTVTMIFDTVKKAPVSVDINSYLDSPSSAVDIDVTFATLQDGTNHVAQSTVVGQDKDVKIQINNSNYVKRT